MFLTTLRKSILPMSLARESKSIVKDLSEKSATRLQTRRIASSSVLDRLSCRSSTSPCKGAYIPFPFLLARFFSPLMRILQARPTFLPSKSISESWPRSVGAFLSEALREKSCTTL